MNCHVSRRTLLPYLISTRFQLLAKELINHDTWRNLETDSLTQWRVSFFCFSFQNLHEAIFVPEENHAKELKVWEGGHQTPVYMTAL